MTSPDRELLAGRADAFPIGRASGDTKPGTRIDGCAWRSI
jgi:hypothetical protein